MVESRGTDWREMLADCCVLAAIVFGVIFLIDLVGWERWLYAVSRPGMLKPVGAIGEGLPRLLLVELSTGLALVGYRRLAGVSGIAWISVFLVETLNRTGLSLFGRSRFAMDLHWIALIAVPLACYVVMLLAPRKRPLHPWRIGWLFGALLLGGVAAPPGPPLQVHLPLAFFNVLLLIALIVGLCLLTRDAWRPVAFALAVTAFALGSWTTGAASLHDSSEELYMATVTIGPLVLMAGVAARLVSARRRPVL